MARGNKGWGAITPKGNSWLSGEAVGIADERGRRIDPASSTYLGSISKRVQEGVWTTW